MAVRQRSIVHQDAISAGYQLESTEHPKCDTFITMDFPLPLLSPVCPLTGNSRHFSTDLAAFDRSLHAIIPNASLTDFAPLSAGAFRQCSTGWHTGNVGLTIGEQSAIRLTTAEPHVIRLCIPLRGGSRYRQSDQDLASKGGNAWVLLAQQRGQYPHER